MIQTLKRKHNKKTEHIIARFFYWIDYYNPPIGFG